MSKTKIEEPSRLKAFVDAVQNLEWKQENKIGSFQKVFSAVDNLVFAEVEYYYRLRTNARRSSGFLRCAGILFAVSGGLIPLLAATGHERLTGLSPWGYVLLAIAAGFYGANQMFGGTSGHVRNVTAQLKLEKIMTVSRLKWVATIAGMQDKQMTEDMSKEAFAQIEAYAGQLYDVLDEETTRWSKELLEELKRNSDQLMAKLDKMKSPGQ
ncbi:MAG: SLATT domain-containing protein [Verrucomicrobiaceae bacterium]|nr:SLATT domain-containing protein [Verrucomicrobiaceae bacterium]